MDEWKCFQVFLLENSAPERKKNLVRVSRQQNTVSRCQGGEGGKGNGTNMTSNYLQVVFKCSLGLTCDLCRLSWILQIWDHSPSTYKLGSTDLRDKCCWSIKKKCFCIFIQIFIRNIKWNHFPYLFQVALYRSCMLLQ